MTDRGVPADADWNDAGIRFAPLDSMIPEGGPDWGGEVAATPLLSSVVLRCAALAWGVGVLEVIPAAGGRVPLVEPDAGADVKLVAPICGGAVNVVGAPDGVPLADEGGRSKRLYRRGFDAPW